MITTDRTEDSRQQRGFLRLTVDSFVHRGCSSTDVSFLDNVTKRYLTLIISSKNYDSRAFRESVVHIRHCLFTTLKTREYSSLSLHQRYVTHFETYRRAYEGIRTVITENLYECIHRNYKRNIQWVR